jgi:hypothetical protein
LDGFHAHIEVTVDRVKINKKATPAKQAERQPDFVLPSLGELPQIAEAKPKRRNTKYAETCLFFTFYSFYSLSLCFSFFSFFFPFLPWI